MKQGIIVSEKSGEEIYEKAKKISKNKTPLEYWKISIKKESPGINFEKIARSKAKQEIGNLEKEVNLAIIEKGSSSLEEQYLIVEYYNIENQKYNSLIKLERKEKLDIIDNQSEGTKAKKL